MKEDRRKCLGAGCDDYMAKPIEKQKLLEMVANHSRIESEEEVTL